ncbi:MAG: hypothetical protein LC100_06050 [Chitinophagales bacterium]|nr:hypothetical protein [Chitinophagales bacterium]
MNRFYELLVAKHNSKADFMAFITYMIKQRAYINEFDEGTKEDFLYHFDLLPKYIDEQINKGNNDILRKLATIEIACKSIMEVIR